MNSEVREPAFASIKKIGDISADGVFIYSVPRARFNFVNERLVNILEIDKKILKQDPKLLLSLLKNDESYARISFQHLLNYGSLEELELSLSTASSERKLLINAYVLQSGKFVVGFVKDISTEKEHEEYLIKFGARKDAVLDAVSQNLTTPLNLSRFTIDLIEKAVKEKKYGKLTSHVSLMREVTTECIRIIDELLIDEYIQSPEISVKTSRFDSVEKTMVVIDKMKEVYPRKHFVVELPSRIIIRNDELKFFQVIHSVLSNAAKFTHDGGIVTVQASLDATTVKFIITDNGIGIPQEIQPFVFHQNSKARRPGLKGESSTGIGMYVSKQLVDLMKGNISFESTEGTGTAFTIELPK